MGIHLPTSLRVGNSLNLQPKPLASQPPSLLEWHENCGLLEKAYKLHNWRNSESALSRASRYDLLEGRSVILDGKEYCLESQPASDMKEEALYNYGVSQHPTEEVAVNV
nr:hypothetical transcript [Hymenolepis microstoma]